MTDPSAARVLVAQALDLAPEEVAADGDVETVAGWDSLGHVKVILAVETALGRTLASGELAQIRGVADIERLLAAARG